MISFVGEYGDGDMMMVMIAVDLSRILFQTLQCTWTNVDKLE